MADSIVLATTRRSGSRIVTGRPSLQRPGRRNHHALVLLFVLPDCALIVMVRRKISEFACQFDCGLISARNYKLSNAESEF